jgi:hypothetical protein
MKKAPHDEEVTSSLSPVGRCGSAAPTYRRRCSCGQDARAPLWRVGAARPRRPTMFDHGARCSMDGLGQDVPATMKRCPARCRAQPAGSWRSPFEEIASSITTQSTDLWGQRSLPKKKRLLHLLSSPGRAMRLCSADLSPQVLMRARCPRSLVESRRREAASPYRDEEPRLKIQEAR